MRLILSRMFRELTSIPRCPGSALAVLAWLLPCAVPVAESATAMHTAAQSAAQSTEETSIPDFVVGEVSYLWSGSSGFETVPGAEFQNEEALVTVPVPLHRDENTILAAALYYRWNRMGFSGFPRLPRDLDLHQLYVPFHLLYDHDEKWSFWFFVAPGLVTDFVHLDSDAFDLAARFVAFYTVNERLTLVAGASNSREFGEETVTPIFGSIWNLSPRWLARLTFPRPSLIFAPREGTLFSLHAQPGGGGWSFFSPAQDRNVDLDYSSIRAGLSAEQKVGKFGAAFVEGGYQFGQEFEIEGLSREFDLDPTWYFSTGMRLRF